MNDMNDNHDETPDQTGDQTRDQTQPVEGDGPPDEADDRTTMFGTTPAETAYDEPTPRTHPLSVGYLVCGLVFLGIAASWGLRQLGMIGSDGEQWVLPLVLVVAGGAGLLALMAKSIFRPRRDL